MKHTNSFIRLGILILFILLISQPILAATDKQAVVVSGQNPLPSENNSLRFEHLSVDDGLSHATVLSVAQDHEGFIWFATADGLDRYDGKKITVFRHDEDDPTSISHNNIFALLVSRDGTLWVGTDPGGLNRYDPATNTFVAYLNDPEDPQSLSDNGVWSLFEDRNGTLWVGTRNGLNRFNAQEENFDVFLPNAEVATSLTGSIVYCIYEDDNENLWVGTRDGLNLMDRDEGTFRLYENDPDDETSLNNNKVWSVYQDHMGDLWIGTRGGGVSRFDVERGSFVAFQHDEDDPYSLSDNNVWKIYEDSTGTVWVSTERGGLNRFNRETNTFTSYQHNPNIPDSLSHNDVFWMFEDESGVLWVSSRRAGINMVYPALQRFALYRHIPEEPNSLKANYIGGIVQQDDGILWVGTVGGGLSRIDREKGLTRTFLHYADDEHSLPGNDIYTLFMDEEGMIWIGTQGAGISWLNPTDFTFTNYKMDPEIKSSIASNYIPAMAQAQDGKLWLGTLGFGLDLFDPKIGTAIHYMHDTSDPQSLGDDTIYGLTQAQDGKLWIATGRKGADLFDPQTGIFQHFTHTPQDEFSLANDTVNVIHQDANGTVWLGTSAGLSRLDIGTWKFINYTTEDGLPGDAIYGILSDNDNDIWLSTGNGIVQFDVQNNLFYVYDTKDGVQSVQFNQFSYYHGKNGELFFGGPEGLNAFFPESISQGTYHPPVVFTGMQLFNQIVQPGTLPLAQTINHMHEIVLKYDQSVFTIEFAALNYQASDKNLYQYKMAGFDKDWSPATSQTNATYTNLNPGMYEFMVRASNNDHVWNDEVNVLRVVIQPPWWKMPWFIISVGMLGLTLIGGFFWLRIRSIHRVNQQLENRVEERTSDLQKANEMLRQESVLREKIEQELIAANDRLRDQLHEIGILRDTLEIQAMQDSLTGLYNRRFLERDLERELSRSGRSKTPTSVLMIDIDHFKTFNDTYGHRMGDQVLVAMGNLLAACSRQGDIACRYGGEEFVLALSGASLENAKIRAEEIREKFKKILNDEIEVKIPATVSIGISTFPQHGEDVETLLDHADIALYQAKESGRDCVKAYQSL